jgi:hypothetical protein
MTWILVLNDMRSAQVENVRPVLRAGTRAALEALIERETVPHYSTPQGRAHYGTELLWHKSFREGGPLEWFNPPMPHDIEAGRVFIEIDVEQRVARFRAAMEEDLARIPHIGIDVPGHEMTPPALSARTP